MASVYRHRNGWQASVTVDGRNQKKNFADKKSAVAWADEMATDMRKTAHTPRLGGPAKVTLARMLFEYAHLYTIGKRSYKSELDRISRYLEAASLPRLKAEVSASGGITLRPLTQPLAAQALPRAFAAHRRTRMDNHAGTHEWRTHLANRLVKDLSPADFRTFLAKAKSDGLSDSTMQKELALLKHAFNMASNEWNWVAFESPLAKLKIPKGGPPRDKVLSAEAEARFKAALAECDNPLMLPLFEFAIETTGRRGSLLKLHWSDIDLEAREAVLHRTKSGKNVHVPLTQRAVEILRNLPREAGEARVFPMSAEAVGAAWDRACERAGLSDFRFHDTRHIGTTRHARRLRNPSLLKQITGLQTDAMLARYTHFMLDDVLELLDATEPAPPSGSPTPTCAGPATPSIGEMRRLNKARRVQSTTPSVEAIAEAAHPNAAAGNVVAVDFAARRRAVA
ncbi:integrase [Pandoraea terrae]|uniref:Integrase n=1 Tax=Pandoraea terrae TaxID=1537710 RepID=A0A5E4X5Z0_9BURK|nr:site-specific integrase [Pandoraea terrae]VVE31648.1 integrase [Pandoraea terrae]